MASPGHSVPAEKAPLGDRICAVAVVAFALFTVCAHAAVVSGASLRTLVGAYAAAVLLLVLGWLRMGRPSGTPAPLEPRWEPPAPLPRSLSAPRGVALGAAVLVVAAAVRWGDGLSVWLAVAGVLAVAAVFVLPAPPRFDVALRSTRREAALFGLAGLCAVVALAVHRPDLDDAFYVNMAVAAADAPDAPLLASDTLHGVSGLPLHLAVYRLHTWELWNGALAWLSGIPAIAVFHLISTAGVAVLAVLAHGTLFRRLLPRAWLAGTTALVLVLLAAADSHRWYGNLAFVRIWQGKGLFLFVFLPLVWAYALDFAARPRPRAFLLLAAVQIASVGATSSAIWAAPAAALGALASGVPLSRRGLAILGVGAAASVYPLGAGLLLLSEMQSVFAEVSGRSAELGAPLASSLEAVLGDGRLRRVALVATAMAWACAPPGLARRFAVVVPLSVWVVLLGPWWADLVRDHVVGLYSWRALWALPVPVLLALVLAAPLRIAGSPGRRVVGIAAAVALALAFTLFVPRYHALAAENGGALGTGIRIGWPGLKVPPEPYRWAGLLVEHVPPGGRVVAPIDISAWVPTFHHPPHPLQVRVYYLYRQRHRIGVERTRERLWMTRFTRGAVDASGAAERFHEGLERFDVSGVVLRLSPATAAARDGLRNAGFRRIAGDGLYELWVRP